MTDPLTQKKKEITIDTMDKQILNLLIANASDFTRTIVKKLAGMGINM